MKWLYVTYVTASAESTLLKQAFDIGGVDDCADEFVPKYLGVIYEKTDGSVKNRI